jgi:hypothetical protein
MCLQTQIARSPQPKSPAHSHLSYNFISVHCAISARKERVIVGARRLERGWLLAFIKEINLC